MRPTKSRLVTVTGAQNGIEMWVLVHASPLKLPLLTAQKEEVAPQAYGEVLLYGVGEQSPMLKAILDVYFNPAKRFNITLKHD